MCPPPADSCRDARPENVRRSGETAHVGSPSTSSRAWTQGCLNVGDACWHVRRCRWFTGGCRGKTQATQGEAELEDGGGHWSDSSRCSRKPAARFILAAHLTGESSQNVQQHEDQVRHPPLGRHDTCAHYVHESISSTCCRKQECAGGSRRGRSVLQRWGQPCRAGI